jgi:RNA polymerase sigma-70 factor (ECF subfamily)
MWRAMYSTAGGRADIAEDAVAEAFARAIVRSDSIRNPVAWLYKTAFRLVVQELKREARQGRQVMESETTPDVEGREDLLAALRRLSPHQRVALVLHYTEQLTVPEIARLIGSSTATVRVHLHRGRRRMRELLEGSEVGHD